MLQQSFFLLTFIFSNLCLAGIQLPGALDSKARSAAIESLAYGSSSKLLSNPYPLGGYSGYELSLTSEFLPLGDVGKLGDKRGSSTDYAYYSLVLGKGLYQNFDVFFHFTPFPDPQGLTNFGGQLRWTYWESNYLPVSIGSVVHASISNIASLVNTRTTGADLIATIFSRDFVVFLGVGTARALGTFTGGAGGITDDQSAATVDLQQMHYVLGTSIQFGEFFVGLEMDRFAFSSYSAKVGFRF